MNRNAGLWYPDRPYDLEELVDEVGRERDGPLKGAVARFDLVHRAGRSDARREIRPPAGVGYLPSVVPEQMFLQCMGRGDVRPLILEIDALDVPECRVGEDAVVEARSRE